MMLGILHLHQAETVIADGKDFSIHVEHKDAVAAAFDHPAAEGFEVAQLRLSALAFGDVEAYADEPSIGSEAGRKPGFQNPGMGAGTRFVFEVDLLAGKRPFDGFRRIWPAFERAFSHG